MHHTRGRNHERGRARRRRAGRIDQLDDDRHARGNAGTDEGARGGRDPRDRRHGTGARGLQRRQARVRRRSRQRAGLRRTDRRRPEGRPRHHYRQDVRQRRPLLVAKTPSSSTRPSPRRCERELRGERRLLPVAAGDRCASRSCSSRPQRLPNPALVGRPAPYIAEQVGVAVPAEHARAHRRAQGRRARLSRSRSRSCVPVLSYYVVADWREGCERCKEILRYGGMGHTMSIHSRNDDVILEFGLKKPAYRIVVNTPTTHGSIGLTTGLDPAMTLGCGGYGGNITSDNISPTPPPEHQASGVRDHAGGRAQGRRTVRR